MTNLQKPCLQCGKTIIKPYNESLKNWLNRHKYCSRNCLGKYRAKLGVVGIPFTKERHYVPPTAIKKGQRLSPKTEFKKGETAWNKDLDGKDYLSNDARDKMAYWKDKSGEGTPNYRGGISSDPVYLKERLRVYHNTEGYKTIRRLIRSKRRALKVSSSDNSITRRAVESMITYQGGKCNICKMVLKNYHIDHIIPLSRGGGHTMGNIQITCPTCNIKKGNKILTNL